MKLKEANTKYIWNENAMAKYFKFIWWMNCIEKRDGEIGCESFEHEGTNFIDLFCKQIWQYIYVEHERQCIKYIII